VNCPNCGATVSGDDKYCSSCGAAVSEEATSFILTTIESMFGGEVTAFTTELEKARIEAMERVKAKAIRMGANALVGLDLETSDMGYQMGIIVISATGTAVIVEPEN
jgi:uncharacterized protein YbjQ (UPF0145 family)